VSIAIPTYAPGAISSYSDLLAKIRDLMDNRRVLSSIVFVNRNGLRWQDAPSAYGAQDAVQPVEAVGRGRRVHPDNGRACWGGR
jgi:transposase